MKRSLNGWLRRRGAALDGGSAKGGRALLAAALLAGGTAQAAELLVRVVERDTRRPLADAAVCLGTPADPGQFGARRSDADGGVRYLDLPDAPLLLTVSAAGHRGYRGEHRVGALDLTVEVPLPSGGLGPQCHGAPPAAATVQAQLALRADGAERALAVESVQVSHDAQSPEKLRLHLAVRGAPSEYRIAAGTGFADAEWLPFAAQIEHRLADADTAQLYLQLRRVRQVEGGALQSLSEVVRVELR